MTDQQFMEKTKTKVRDSLDEVRTAAQQLHGDITDTLAKQANATSGDVRKLVDKARQSAELARSAVQQRYDAAEPEIQKRLSAAAKRLDNAGDQAAESAAKSGQELRASLSKALTEARASAQQVSEAIAAKRSQINSRS